MAHPDVAGVNVLYNSYRRRAREKPIPFELSREEFKALIEGDCRYCGIEPSTELKYDAKSIGTIFYNGIDRINSSLGYFAGNVASCCKTCNFAKRCMTEEEFLNWIDRVHRHSIQKGPS